MGVSSHLCKYYIDASSLDRDDHSCYFNLYREFVGCVRCIRILSPVEVQQMSEEGIRLLNSATVQGINGAS